MIRAFRQRRVTLLGYFLYVVTKWAMGLVITVVCLHIGAMA
jgi:hypothetical protein